MPVVRHAVRIRPGSPMSKNARFFEDGRQAAAVLKHGVLRRYLSSFSRMVGKNSPDHSVGFLDAYAGNGEYVHPITRQKTPGSPLIALDVAERTADRNLHCVFVERNGAHASNLRKAVELNGNPLAAVIRGDIEKHVDDSLNGFSNMPLFVLLDPFGTALQTQVLVQLQHRRGPPNWFTLLPSRGQFWAHGEPSKTRSLARRRLVARAL
jgi:three-Cys-motif partner protein